MDCLTASLVCIHGKLKVHEILQFGAATKECLSGAKIGMEHLRKNWSGQNIYKNGKQIENDSFRKPEICQICHNVKTTIVNPFSKIYNCMGCRKPDISHTDAKTKYKLDDNDLANLDYHVVYIRTYRIYATLYNPKDVLGYALAKHGTLKLVKKRGLENKALKKREEQLEKYLVEYIPLAYHADVREYSFVMEFLKNGADGVRNLKRELAEFSEFIDCLDKKGVEVNQYIRMFPKYLQNRNWVVQYVERKQELVEMLASYGLELRDDSSLCKQYMKGQENDLAFVITTMRQMDFLMKNTNYQEVMSEILDQAYERAREDIRMIYGHISDPDEYREILRGFANPHECSARAKQKVLAAYKGTLPDYF